MKKLSPKAVRDLVARCRGGDEQAWHQLIDFIAPYIFAICSRSRLTRDEGFDVFGQVSYQLINSIENLKDPAKLFSFVGTITRREIYAYYQKIMMTDYIDDEVVKSLPDKQGNNPEQDMILLEKRELLLSAMLELPARDYKLMKMLYFDPGKPSYKEIAAKLDMPVSSIGPVRGKVFNKLYKLLKDRYLEE